MPLGTRNGTKRGERILTAAIAVIALALLAWWSAETASDRRQTQSRAFAILHAAQTLLNEYAGHGIGHAQDALDRIAYRVLRDGPPAAGATSDWHAWLASQQERLPGVATLSYVGPDGRMAATSWAPDAGADVSDRDYFRAHRDGARLYVSQPMAGRPGGAPLFRLSLRIEDAGRFAGVAVAAFRPGYFATFHRSTELPAVPLTMAILQTDGALIAQEPRNGLPDLPSQSRPFGRDPALGERVILLHGTPHYVSLARLPDVPLLVAVTAPEAAVLAAWHRRALMSGTLAGVCVAVTVLLGLLAVRSLRREQAVLVALQDTNAELAVALRANQDARRVAESASAAKSRMLAAVSHDLGQPLRALQFHLEAFDDDALAPPERALLDKMRMAAAAQQDMLEQLVAASAIEHGALPVQRRSFPLAPVLAEAADLCRNEAARTGVDLRVVTCSLHLTSDPTLLRRLLMNLIANAARYTADGRVLVGCRRGDEALRIEVWDTGPGLSPDDAAVIFDEFHRGAAAAGTAGLGLGLSIVRRLADTLEMTVTVRSTPGHGSCFAVSIPWDQVHESDTPPDYKFPSRDGEFPTHDQNDDECRRADFIPVILPFS